MSLVQEATLAVASGELEQQLEEQRKALTGYCYRMLASPFEAEDVVQETLLRAWRGFDAQPGEVGTCDRAPDNEVDGGLLGHRY